MSKASHAERLADIRNVTVILRLALNQRGQVIRGEMVDAEARLPVRFVGRAGLVRVLRTWLDSQKLDGPSERV